MAWPGTLNEDEQQSLLDFVNLFRTSIGELARTNNHLSVCNDEYNGQQNPNDGHLSKIDDNDVIPNTSGLVGAEPLTKSEVINLVSYAQVALQVNSEFHRQAIAKGCGETNMIG